MNLDVTETFTTVKQLEVKGDDFYRQRRVKLTKKHFGLYLPLNENETDACAQIVFPEIAAESSEDSHPVGNLSGN